ncbi:MAG: hypothetical protein IT361_06750 [Gemmatimonadaceae bacterium]|nr:hypothetical protein [Gemmatimonadaceae bacterium]
MFDALWASGDRFHGRRPCTAERIVDAPVESQAAAISSLADGLALARGAAMMHAGPEPCLA